MLTRLLNGEGYAVETVSSGAAMRQKLKNWPCDLLILDLRLPAGEDGLEIAQSIRMESTIGLIMLTGRSESVDKVVGLEIGADDYVTKPFEPRELLARIRSVLRRVTRREENTSTILEEGSYVRFIGWTFNLEKRELTDVSGS
ncbi:MAG: response regulator, partial [Planctomycetota bacterium]